MIKHTYLKNLTLNVPTSVNSAGKLHLDEDGNIIEELTFEQESELIDHPDFVTVESGKFPPEADQPSAEKVESEDHESEGKGTDQEQEQGEGEKDEDKTEDELKEFDTKIVNGKGFIYKKNKADVLMWLRHSEIDEKG